MFMYMVTFFGYKQNSYDNVTERVIKEKFILPLHSKQKNVQIVGWRIIKLKNVYSGIKFVKFECIQVVTCINVNFISL